MTEPPSLPPKVPEPLPPRAPLPLSPEASPSLPQSSPSPLPPAVSPAEPPEAPPPESAEEVLRDLQAEDAAEDAAEALPVGEAAAGEGAAEAGPGFAHGLAAGVSAALMTASWWAISLVFHGLVIVLLTLVTWAVRAPKFSEDILVVTTLEPARDVQQVRPEVNSQLAGDRDANATDPDSTVKSDIEVPPDILARAELGDHFETINPDRPDTHSAFGTPEAHMFHSVSGSIEPAGGGGSGGLTFDEVIGMGGNNSPGKGGGWGGGTGTGVGNDTGPGRGSFGQRNGGGRRLMVMRHGGSRATESAVDRALRWLALHQEPDGHWDCAKYGGQNHDTAVAGLALLAFLGAGHTEKVGPYKDNVRRAVGWLRQSQKSNGALDSGYSHAIAGMALAEAAGMARVPETVAAAQKAIDWTTKRDPKNYELGAGPWRYGGAVAENSQADLSVTGWFVMQLKSAKVAGLDVPKQSFEKAIKFLDSVMVEVSKDEGYGPTNHYQYQPGKDHGNRVNAIGCLCRQFLGWKKEELENSVKYFVEKGGVPNSWPAKADLYYWYYGTLCTFQQGGELWNRWNTEMKKTLCENQAKGGDEDGSWEPVGAFAKNWGRVGQTALCALCLEVYYRYLPMYR